MSYDSILKRYLKVKKDLDVLYHLIKVEPNKELKESLKTKYAQLDLKGRKIELELNDIMKERKGKNMSLKDNLQEIDNAQFALFIAENIGLPFESAKEISILKKITVVQEASCYEAASFALSDLQDMLINDAKNIN